MSDEDERLENKIRAEAHLKFLFTHATPLHLLATVVDVLALVLLWHWFVVPLGIPRVNFAHMLGLIFFVSLLRRKNSVPESQDKFEPEKWQQKTRQSFQWRVLTSVYCILVGWIAHFFV